MKIGILIDQLIWGGVQAIALKQAQELKKSNHKIDILVLVKQELDQQLKELTKGLNLVYLSDHYPKLFRQSIRIPPFSFLSTGLLISPYLAPQILNEQYDFLIAHGSTTCLTAQAIYRKKGIPYFAFVYDPMIYIFNKIYKKTLLSLLSPPLIHLIKTKEHGYLKHAMAILTQSTTSQNQLRSNYHINATVVTPGCNPLPQIPLRRGKHLLALSRWSLKKNPKFMLRVISAIPQSKLIIAGSWENKADLKKFHEQIEHYQLNEHVQLVTSISEKEKMALFQNARAWIHPHFEGFGVGALTAASCGCPIIMPKDSGAAKLFKHDIHGYFPQENNLDEYISFTGKLAENERLAWKLGKNAWKEVREKHTWDNHVKKIADIADKKLTRIPFIIIETGHVSSVTESGGERIIKKLLKFLPENFDYNVILPQLTLPFWRNINNNTKLIPLPKDPFCGSQNRMAIFINYLWRAYHSRRALNKFKCQQGCVLYSSTNIFPDVIPAYLYKKHYPQIRWIARIHHLTPPPNQRAGNPLINWFIYPIQKATLKMIKQGADLIPVLNNTLRKTLLEKGFSDKKTKTSGAGINYSDIKNHQAIKELPYDAVFLGRLHPSKGVFDLPAIWARVCQDKKGARIAIVGETSPKIKKLLTRKFQRHNVGESNYVISGYLPRPKMLNILKNSKVFLFCDHEAGWGIAIAEAMACKIPVIGYNLPLFGDVFKKGFITVPCFNTQRFGQEIVSLLNDRTCYQKLSQEAHEQAIGLSWEKAGIKFKELVDNLVN